MVWESVETITQRKKTHLRDPNYKCVNINIFVPHITTTTTTTLLASLFLVLLKVQWNVRCLVNVILILFKKRKSNINQNKKDLVTLFTPGSLRKTADISTLRCLSISTGTSTVGLGTKMPPFVHLSFFLSLTIPMQTFITVISYY